MSDTPTTTSDEPEAEEAPERTPEELREEQRVLQNLPEGAVPEQRPQASQQTDPSDAKSDLTRKLEEAEHSSTPVTEPMGQEAYDRANSDEQAKAAAKESITEAVMMGNIAVSTKGPHEGRVFAITRVLSYQKVSDLVNKLAGVPEQLYSQPDQVEGRAIGDERDGELLILSVEDDGLQKQNEAVRGTRAGRRH